MKLSSIAGNKNAWLIYIFVFIVEKIANLFSGNRSH
jgi:hypothetical protein